jgi:3-deoxy-7-phosphoheptulonate synthase
MIIVMKMGAGQEEIAGVIASIEAMGFAAHVSSGKERTIIGIIGNERPLSPESFELLPGVERAMRVLHPFRLASRDFRPEDTVISLNGEEIGGRKVVVMAGPCAVESREQMREVAYAVKEAGVRILRGGAFKPRTSPYSFQGLGEEGLEILAEIKEEVGLAIVTEVMAPEQVPLVARYADILQIGTRSMQNYALLHAVGESGRPVLLKRGMMATLEELLLSAEYILLTQGNAPVMLCERGIRTFDNTTRNTLDINAVPVLGELTHLPIVVDPSHGTGKWQLVGAVAKAAVAAGADGLLIEVHPWPERALSDGAQSLKPEKFAQLVVELRRVAEAVDRSL